MRQITDEMVEEILDRMKEKREREDGAMAYIMALIQSPAPKHFHNYPSRAYETVLRKHFGPKR